MPVTLKDVAHRAGVSTSAVSRTFTEGASVSEKTRAKVLEAADALGYAPSLLASSLTTRRTKLIGLVFDNFKNPIFLEIFDLFTQGLQAKGLRPLLVNLSGQTEPAASVRMLRQYSVDGVIVASSTLLPSFAHEFRAAGLPVVHSFGRYSPDPRVHVVGIDNRYCGVMAARTLIERGYRRIGFMGGPESATSTQDRLLGFLDAAGDHRDVTVSHSFSAAYSFAAGRAEMERLIGAGRLAQAYFCGDDVLSLGALSALHSAGLEVPGDVGILGLNDMEMAGWDGNDLTTIRQPVREIISSSVDLIDTMLNDPERAPEARLFRCSIVERKTLRPVPQSV